MFFAEQNGLSDRHKGIGEIHPLFAIFGYRHPAKDNVESSQNEGRNDDRPPGIHKDRFYAQVPGHFNAHVDVEADKVDLPTFAADIAMAQFPLAPSSASKQHLESRISGSNMRLIIESGSVCHERLLRRHRIPEFWP